MLRYSWGIGVLALVGCGYAAAPSSGGSSTGVAEPVPDGFAAAGSAAVGGGQPPLPGAIFAATTPPPPISGGTLLGHEGSGVKLAVVADPDRDQVLIVDLASVVVARTLTLEAHSEPGRAAEDAAGNIHLVLRGSGKLMTFNPTTGDVLGTRSVCTYPRGVAVSTAENLVHVACAEGKLVTLTTTATDITPTRTITLDSDLRDVVVASDGLWVSRFRSAEVLRLDSSGTLIRRTTLPSSTSKPRRERVVSRLAHGGRCRRRCDRRASARFRGRGGSEPRRLRRERRERRPGRIRDNDGQRKRRDRGHERRTLGAATGRHRAICGVGHAADRVGGDRAPIATLAVRAHALGAPGRRAVQHESR